MKLKSLFSLFLFSNIATTSLWCNSDYQLPSLFQHFPRADISGLVIDAKKLEIPGIPYLYNASIIEDRQGGYYLFFRVDTPHTPPYVSHILCAQLDHNFNVNTNSVKTLDTQSEHSEDPRALWVGDELWVVYNDESPGRANHRIMKTAKIDTLSLQVEAIYPLDIGIKKVEKNWVPFALQSEWSDKEELYFSYTIQPHAVLSLNQFLLGEKDITHFFSNQPPKILWPKCWGPIRGGTPAKKINEHEYLAFFHSSFLDGRKTRWYIVGAYIFEAKAPYEVTRISQWPILFKGIYDTPSYRDDLYVLFPAGFVIEKHEEGDLIHLSCGENDTGIKIITLDMETLLQSLKPSINKGRQRFHLISERPR